MSVVLYTMLLISPSKEHKQNLTYDNFQLHWQNSTLTAALKAEEQTFNTVNLNDFVHGAA